MKKLMGIIVASLLIAAVAITGVFVATTTNKVALTIPAQAEIAIEEPTTKPATEEESLFSEEESTEIGTEDVSAFEQITLDGQQIFIGDQEAVIDYLSSLTRQTWLELATLDREVEFYARVLPWQSEVVRDDAFVSAYRMTADQCEYSILRDGALLVQDAQGEVDVDYSTTKVSGVNDRTYPRDAYSEQDEALYEGKVLAIGYTQANAMGTLKVSAGFDRQDMFSALVVAEGDFDNGVEYVHGYFIAWRIIEGPAPAGKVNNPQKHDKPSKPAKPTAKPTTKPTEKPTAKPTAKPTEKPTAKPTEKPTAKPTPAHSTPEPEPKTTPAHSTPEPESEPAHSTPKPTSPSSHTEPTGDFKDSKEDPKEVMGDDCEPAKPDTPAHTEPKGDFKDSTESSKVVMDQAGDPPRQAAVKDESAQKVEESASSGKTSEPEHSAPAEESKSTSTAHTEPKEDDFESSDEEGFWS